MSNPLSQLTALTLALGTVSFTEFFPALAQQEQRRILTVIGQGVVSVPTTKTQVNLGVEVQGKTAAEVQQEVASRSSAVVDLLKSRNVQKLQTAGIRLQPTYSNEGNRRRPTGFQGSNTVSFQIGTQQIGNLLDEAVQAGATTINRVSFAASDEAIAIAKQQAIRAATQDAQMQADAALSALNLTRRDIIKIQINQSPFVPIFQDAAAARTFGTNANPLTPVVGGEQQVQAFVTLEITY